MFLNKLPRRNILQCMGGNAAAFSTNRDVQEKKIDVNGQTINYVKVGSGMHTVLCFPGALGTIWSDFKPQIENLDQSDFTVVAWDPPGYGNSRPPERKFGVDFFERDAETARCFMNELGMGRFSVLGWSDGGISAMILAAKHPNTVRKLVIWGANSYVVPSEIQVYENLRNISNWSEKMKGPLIGTYGEQALSRMWDEWCDTLLDIYRKNNGDICKELLPKITCPTFILHGEKDPMIAQEHPKYLIQNIGPSKIYSFPEGKHNIHLRYAKEFNELVSDFLRTKHTGK